MAPIPCCVECGAALPASGACRDHFNNLLLLESQIPGGPTGLSHFYAVGVYLLQHPDSMNMRRQSLVGLRSAIADALDGRVTIEDVRRRARQGAAAMGRVTRRPGEPEFPWRRGSWPATVTDVLGVEPKRDDYLVGVSRWARLVVEALAAATASV